MCGATGATISTSGSTAARGTEPRAVRWLFSTMSFAMAVLMRIAAISSPTSAIVRASRRAVTSSSGSSVTVTAPVSSSTTFRHSRWRKRCEPTTARVSHGRETSRGPIDIS